MVLFQQPFVPNMEESEIFLSTCSKWLHSNRCTTSKNSAEMCFYWVKLLLMSSQGMISISRYAWTIPELRLRNNLIMARARFLTPHSWDKA